MLGSLEKMQAELGDVVQYRLPVGDQSIELNPLLGQQLQLRHSGQIYCLYCRKKTNKSFNQGYCYPCFIRLAQCDMCIVKPETCHYDNGTCREPAWGEAFCFQPHVVYLANSSGIKVGITRQSQIPTRWIDQGAVQALPILQTRSRQIAGLIEVAIAQHVSDKTSWQQMLKKQADPIDLVSWRDKLLGECRDTVSKVLDRFGSDAAQTLADAKAVEINYPIQNYPGKITSFNFDKQPLVTGTLQGIKGQYLIFDSGVINIRKFGGYQVELTI